jgi:hypothetical protein
MSLEHVQPGQKLRIPAADYNACLDAARDLRARRAGQPGRLSGDHRTDRGLILVRNDSGEDLEAFDILGLGAATTDVWPTPDDNESAFKYGSPFFLGKLPALADHVGRFCVVLGAMAKSGDGHSAIGPAAIAGVVPVHVNVLSADDWWADVDDGEHLTLRSGPSGSAQLLYKSAAGTGCMWCLARLGQGLPPGSIDYQTLVWDNVTKRYYAGPLRAMDIPPA